MSVSQNSKPRLIHRHASNNTHRYPQKRAKKSKSGLHDNWIERTRIEAGDDDWQTWTGTQSVESTTVHSGYAPSRSSAVSATGSSQPMNQPNSDDKDEGGITDDAGETAEHRNLSGKPQHLERLKSYYGGKSKASETSVIISIHLLPLLTALTGSGLPLQIHALACIVPTSSVPAFIKPSTSSHVWCKKGDICLSDLSHHLQADFADKFTPRLYEVFGTLSAWEQPTENDIRTLWKKIFPHESSLNFGTSKGVIILKLVSNLTTSITKGVLIH